MKDKKAVIMIIALMLITVLFIATGVFAFFGGMMFERYVNQKTEKETESITEEMTPIEPETTEETVEVLPEIDRNEKDEHSEEETVVDDILHGAKLKGVMDVYGNKSAVLETTSGSYTLLVGDTVGDSDWIVTEITDKSITLTSGEQTKTFTKE